MKRDVYRFAGEFDPPDVTLSPLIDRGVSTLRFRGVHDQDAFNTFREAIAEWIVPDDEIVFNDIAPGRTPNMVTLIDRYEDVTGGIHPGDPTIKLRKADSETQAAEIDADSSNGLEATDSGLRRFYKQTGFRPHIKPSTDSGKAESTATITRTFGGESSRVFANILLPEEDPLIKSLLHELGHCALLRAGLNATRTLQLDPDDGSYYFHTEWHDSATGLTYTTEDGVKGDLVEEAVVDGIGSFVNRRLGLAPTRHNDDRQTVPEMVAPYLWTATNGGSGHSTAAPSAVAFELIAQELGLPAERYFKMFVDYARAGVENMDARQEVAASVYRGTRGKLTLADIEELPYPTDHESNLALLWAVEDALDVPDHQRYSELF